MTKTLGSGWAEEKEQKHEVKPQQEKTNKKPKTNNSEHVDKCRRAQALHCTKNPTENTDQDRPHAECKTIRVMWFREKVLKRKASKRGPISSKLFNLKIVTVKHSKKELIRKSKALRHVFVSSEQYA